MSQHEQCMLDPSVIQMKQQLLHFRSEMVRQDRLLKQVEKKLHERERAIAELTERLAELTEHSTVIDEGENKEHASIQTTPLIHPFFTYSVIMPTLPEESLLIKGHFVIKNEGSVPLTEPIICLSFNHAEDANLSGKIKRHHSNKKKDYQISREGVMDAWHYVEENAEKIAKETGEYWLRPPVNTLSPGKELVFSDFEITVPTKTNISHTVQVYGFVYSSELPSGQQAANVVTLTRV
ncbi:hypothetical protein [Shouchella lonarensis]|uniref:Uncharacterized protein n=1 Tax=Shouchella lonarensis TaxID=1464122 RepID=A0A1G6GLN7_9BACI|nr:hypothetical protein [Shouchella lonarensis]SDB82921.1 hypothetical protein SAMN05421737_101228 [Shouchella lonarensis]